MIQPGRYLLFIGSYYPEQFDYEIQIDKTFRDECDSVFELKKKLKIKKKKVESGIKFH